MLLGRQQPFIDGLRSSNPTKELLAEAKAQYPNHDTHCIVSLGTGHPGITGMDDPSNLTETLREMAEDCEVVHEEMMRRFSQVQSPKYFRLNVQHGLQNVGRAQVERLPEIEAHTISQILSVATKQMLQQVAITLVIDRATPERENIINTPSVILAHACIFAAAFLSTKPMRSRLRTPSYSSERAFVHPPAPTTIFTGREDILSAMERTFFPPKAKQRWHMLSLFFLKKRKSAKSDTPKQKRFVLYGLGGSGKSQIALKFVERNSRRSVPLPHSRRQGSQTDLQIFTSLHDRCQLCGPNQGTF